MKYPVPADVEMPDRIVAGLTARQVCILAADALLLWAMIVGLGPLVPLPILGLIAMPVAALGLAAALARPSGLTAGRLLVLAARYLALPKKLVTAPEGLSEVPGWAGKTGRLGIVEAPMREISDDGFVNLGPDGTAVVCKASAINLGLRSEEEQAVLIEGLARLFNSVTDPVQILVRSDRVDVAEMIEELEEAAVSLPHPALEEWNRRYASYLRELADRGDVLNRTILFCLRHPAKSRERAMTSLQHSLPEARSILGGIDVRLDLLKGERTARLLARFCGRDSYLPEGHWSPDRDVIGSAG